MNPGLEKFARDTLKEKLHKCYPPQRRIFARMYSHENLWLSIEDMVDQMPPKKLDWAVSQVERTIEKNEHLLKEYHDTL